jgi:peptide/nickel transport system substrate-binding protein
VSNVVGEFEESGISRLLEHEFSRRQLLLGAGGVSLAAVLAACGNSSNPTASGGTSSTAPTHAKKQTLTVAVEDLGNQTPDPHLCRAAGAGYTILYGVAENLARRDLNEKIVAALATAWNVSADGLSWTFTLRPGVKMQDGSTFTANDVKTAFDRIRSPDFKPGFSALQHTGYTVNVIDPMHVTVITPTPYATMLDDMPVPIPTAYYQQVGEATFRQQPMAAGGFKFVSQQINQSMTFERFDDFYDKSRLTNFKTLVMQLLTDEAGRVTAIQSGQVDAAHGLSPISVLTLSGTSSVKILHTDSIGEALIYFNDLNFPTANTPFNNVQVRQALDYAIDRKAIANSLFKGGFAVPTGNFWFKATPGYDTSLSATPYDPGKAKSLLRAAGQPNLTIALGSKNIDATIAGIQQVALAVQNYWQAIGATVTYTAYSSADSSAHNAAKNWPSGAQISPFPGNLLLDPGTPSQIVYNANGGAPRVNDPQLTAMVIALTGILDPKKRAAAALAIVKYVKQNAYTLALFDLNGAVAIGPNVNNWAQQTSMPYASPWWTLQAN